MERCQLFRLLLVAAGFLEIWELGHVQQGLSSMHATFCRSAAHYTHQGWNGTCPAYCFLPVQHKKLVADMQKKWLIFPFCQSATHHTYQGWSGPCPANCFLPAQHQKLLAGLSIIRITSFFNHENTRSQVVLWSMCQTDIWCDFIMVHLQEMHIEGHRCSVAEVGVSCQCM